MNVGFKKDSFIRISNIYLILDKINENLETANILSKDYFTINRCLKIIFNDHTELICSEFVNIYSITDNKFVPAYSLKKDTIVKGYDKEFKVINISVVFNVECVNLNFKNKPIYFINDVLCHTYEDYSDYELDLIQNNKLSKIDMSQINKAIYPNRDKFNIQIKFNQSTWKNGNFLLDYNFEKDTTGYVFNKKIEVQICVEKNKINDHYLFFNCFSSKITVSPKEFLQYNNNVGQLFLIYDLNKYINDQEMIILNFTFQSEEESILNNCVILNKIEYNRIIDYFQGLLVLN